RLMTCAQSSNPHPVKQPFIRRAPHDSPEFSVPSGLEYRRADPSMSLAPQFAPDRILAASFARLLGHRCALHAPAPRREIAKRRALGQHRADERVAAASRLGETRSPMWGFSHDPSLPQNARQAQAPHAMSREA